MPKRQFGFRGVGCVDGGTGVGGGGGGGRQGGETISVIGVN